MEIQSKVNTSQHFKSFRTSLFGSLSVGIIGEQISGFNPFTLAPFGDEEEEEEDGELDKEKSNENHQKK